jgi:hypothetical protein
VTAARLSTALFLSVVALGCGSPPPPSPARTDVPPPVGKRRGDIPADCEPQPGKPPPEPLRATYTGLARAARCQDEVFTIMGGVTHFLGVACKHCHQEPDYAADTHNKRVANWMARELVPRLRKRFADASGAREVWCQDCHAGKPKLLGNPRRRDLAIEWMTTHLGEAFETPSGQPPHCPSCHGGDLGSPEFRAQVILSALPASASVLTASPADAASAPAAVPTPAPSADLPAEPLPDLGGR